MKLALCLLVLLPLAYSIEFRELTEEEKRNLFHIHVPHISSDQVKHWAQQIWQHMKAAGASVYSHSACVSTCKSLAPSPLNLACDTIPIVHTNGICHYVDQLFQRQ